jgi:hypothetical protein
MYGDDVVAGAATAEWSPTPQERAISALRMAIEWAPKDKAVAAACIEAAMPYFGMRKAGRRRALMTVNEERLELFEKGMPIEEIAALHHRRPDIIERSLRRARARRGGQ